MNNCRGKFEPNRQGCKMSKAQAKIKAKTEFLCKLYQKQLDIIQEYITVKEEEFKDLEEHYIITEEKIKLQKELEESEYIREMLKERYNNFIKHSMNKYKYNYYTQFKNHELRDHEEINHQSFMFGENTEELDD